MFDRISKLRDLLLDDKHAFLVTSDVNRVYLSTFKSSAGAVFITKNSAYLFVDFRYYEAAKNAVSNLIDVVCYKKLNDSINEILINEGITNVIVEEADVTLKELAFYKKNLKADIATDFDLSEKLYDLRAVKSENEIGYIVEAQNIAEKSFTELFNFIKSGVTEKALALELEYLMKKYGAEKSAFDIIVVSGKNSSLPHGVPTEKEVCDGDFITFDFGAVVNGYHSDMTRTVVVNHATDEMHQVYDTVLKSHTLAASVIKSNVKCSDVDIAARDFITSKGYGEYFGHSTGHGVGLEIHEKPTVYKTNNDILKPNTVITVEPGIYIPEKFGVRIEDMYMVTDSGFKDLTTFTKELLIL